MQKPIHADSERGSTNKACDFHVTLFGHEDELEEEITPSDSGSVVSGPIVPPSRRAATDT